MIITSPRVILNQHYSKLDPLFVSEILILILIDIDIEIELLKCSPGLIHNVLLSRQITLEKSTF